MILPMTGSSTRNTLSSCKERSDAKPVAEPKLTHPFLLHVDDEGAAIQRPNAKELNILGPVQFLRGPATSGAGAVGGRHQSFDMVGEQ